MPEVQMNDSIRRILETGDTSSISSAFLWYDTPQGHEYWSRVEDAGRLNADSRGALMALVGLDETSNEVKSSPELLDPNPKTTEIEDMYKLKLAYINHDKLELVDSTKYGIVVGGPKVEVRPSCLAPVYTFDLDSYWISTHTVFGFNRVEDSQVEVMTKKNEAGEYELFGELNPIQKQFFKTLEEYLTFMLKLFSRQGSYREGGLLENIYLWTSRETVEMCLSSFSYGHFDYQSALHSTFYFRPKFSKEGVSFFTNLKDFERGRRTTTTIGRYLRKIAPQIKDAEIERAVEKYNKTFVKRDFTLKRGVSRKDFEHAYNGKQAEMLNPRTSSSRKSLANSCMRNMHIEGLSPAEVLGSGDFEILWLEDENGLIGGRVVVYLKKDSAPQAGPIYGVCEHSLDTLQEALDEMGAVGYDDASWQGARLLRIPVYGDDILMLYCDMAEEGWDDGEFIHLDHRDSDTNTQTTEGFVSAGHRTRCCDCGVGVHEDEVYYNDDGDVYCEHCFYRNYYTCDVTGDIISIEDSSSVYTSQSNLYWRASVQNPGQITVGPDVSCGECFYTDELWLTDDLYLDVDENFVSPRYAENNLTEVRGVYYTAEQLLKAGLNEEGEPLEEPQEEEKEEAA